MKYVASIKLEMALMRSIVSCLLLAVTLMTGCEGDDKDARKNKVSQPLKPLTGQEWRPSSAARIDALKAELVKDPDSEALLSQLGDVYFESRRFQEAIPVYEQAAIINPKNADVLNDLGLSYFYIGKTEQALDAVNRATEADPTYKHAWLSTGFILMSSGRPAEAIAPLNKVMELDPGGQLAKTAGEFLQQIETGLGQGTKGPN